MRCWLFCCFLRLLSSQRLRPPRTTPSCLRMRRASPAANSTPISPATPRSGIRTVGPIMQRTELFRPCGTVCATAEHGRLTSTVNCAGTSTIGANSLARPTITAPEPSCTPTRVTRDPLPNSRKATLWITCRPVSKRRIPPKTSIRTLRWNSSRRRRPSHWFRTGPRSSMPMPMARSTMRPISP